ncbi:MAG: hypothetical protein AB7E48_00385 [Deferribacterales bacterium]
MFLKFKINEAEIKRFVPSKRLDLLFSEILDKRLKASTRSYSPYLQYLKGKVDVLKNETIDVARLENDWFPQINADIFLSHSHADVDLVQYFSNWLSKELDLTTFIDSDVWGYKDNLIKELTGSMSNKKQIIRCVDNINIILSTALTKMISETPVFIFLESDNSVENDYSTYSPWIYNELLMTTLIATKKEKMFSASQEALLEKYAHFEYDVEHILRGFPSLSFRQLSEWKKMYDLNDKNAITLLNNI